MSGAFQKIESGNIFTETLKIIKRNLFSLCVVVAIWQIIFYILAIILTFSIFTPTYTALLGETTDLAAALGGFLLFIFVIMVASYIALNLIYPLMFGALIDMVSRQHFQQHTSIRQAFRQAWKRKRPLILVSLPFFLVGICASFCLYILGTWIGNVMTDPMASIIVALLTIVGSAVVVYFIVRWAFVLQVVMVEHLTPIKALSRSSALVKNNWWQVLAIMFSMTVIGLIITALLNLIPIIGWIIVALLIPIILIIITASTLIYYDLRIKKEGYSIDALAKELDIQISDKLSKAV